MVTKKEHRWLTYARLTWQLVRADITIYSGIALEQIINTITWVVPTILVATYAFPVLGIAQQFGTFIAVGTIVSVSFFQSFPAATSFVSDLEGNQTISFPLTLPMPSWLIFVQRSISYICKASILSIIVLPMSKLMLLDRLSLAHFSLLKFFVIFFTVHIFTSFFSLFLVCMVGNMSQIMKVWLRFIFPLWFFGCSQYPWSVLEQLSPKLAYACLANPFIYGMEGMRAAVLGQEGSLPFWPCVGMLLLFAVLFGFIAIKRLKKRLDFV